MVGRPYYVRVNTGQKSSENTIYFWFTKMYVQGENVEILIADEVAFDDSLTLGQNQRP